MKLSKEDLTNISLLALIAANLLPLWGVCFLKWDAFYIILLYWSENLAVCFYNILKIAFAKVTLERFPKLFLIPFFMFHYSGFMAVHGLFILKFAKKTHGCQGIIDQIKQTFLVIPSQMRFAILALFISHGISFVNNYLIAGEYKTTNAVGLMKQPYARVVVLHVAIMTGGIFTMTVGSPVPLLFALIIGKIILDMKMHLREHQKAKPLAPKAVTPYTGRNENISNTCSPR